MSWSNKFIGIPQQDHGRSRAGADCWGLACIIYQEELGITLPDYLSYSSPDECGEVSAIIEGEKSSPLWLPVSGPAIAFDIAVFKLGRFSSHVGIVVRHGVMIHMFGQDQSKIERYDRGTWSHRFEGHWRHQDMAGAPALKHPAKGAVERPVQIISEAPR